MELTEGKLYRLLFIYRLFSSLALADSVLQLLLSYTSQLSMPELPESQKSCSIFPFLSHLWHVLCPAWGTWAAAVTVPGVPTIGGTAGNRLWGTRSVTLQEGQSQDRALKWMCLYLLLTMRGHKGLKVLAELKNYPCFIRTWIKQEKLNFYLFF